MASSNIKLFDENKGNMLSDSEFSISTQRLNGLQTGVASSQLQNKAMYQASLVAYAIAQIMMQNGLNANDTDAVSTFVSNLSGAMLQKVYDIATTEEAKAGVATGKWMSPALVKAAIDKTLTDKNYLPKSGGTMTGNLTLNANPTTNLGAATKQYVDSAQSACLLKSGGTMTGNLILNANPSTNLGAATKQYVDSAKSSLQTSINNVRSDLTPVFGDLEKNGYFKLGDMSVKTSNGKNYGFVFDGFYNFISNNIGALNEIIVLIKNSTWKNTNSSRTYSIQVTGGSAFANIFSFAPNVTGTINRILKLTPQKDIYLAEYTDYCFYVSGVEKVNFNSNSITSLFVQSDNANFLAATSIGTAEIWYK